MANGQTHQRVGAWVGGGAALLYAATDSRANALVETLAGALGGWHGAMLPDILEPATSPNHRKVAHSVLTALGLTLGSANHHHRLAELRELAADLADRAYRVRPTNAITAFVLEVAALLVQAAVGYIVGLAAGYASHLVLDAGTPKGLPLFGLD